MKIIFITREGYQLSGARVRCYGFAKQLNRLGFKTRVFSFADQLGAKYGEKEFEMPLGEKLKYNILAFKKLVKENRNSIFFLQRFNYHALAPLLVSLLRKNKVIFDCDDWNIRENPRYYWIFPSSKMEYLTRKTAGYSAACIVASRYLKDYLSPFNRKVEYIPTGVDTDSFTPAKNKEGSKVVFSWAGTVYSSQMRDNIVFLLNCFKEVARFKNNVFIRLAGCGKYYQKLKTEFADFRYRERVKFYDWIDSDKMPEHLADIDIGLLPLIQNSRFNQAKSPTKLFEYMSMAKPVVASVTGEASFIIRPGETGFLAKNKSEFIAGMLRLAEDSRLRKEVGERAREEVVRAYSLKFLGKQLADFIDNL
jgi:glycosyltransferase involved in cell wall biosynthesis